MSALRIFFSFLRLKSLDPHPHRQKGSTFKGSSFEVVPPCRVCPNKFSVQYSCPFFNHNPPECGVGIISILDKD